MNANNNAAASDMNKAAEAAADAAANATAAGAQATAEAMAAAAEKMAQSMGKLARHATDKAWYSYDKGTPQKVAYWTLAAAAVGGAAYAGFRLYTGRNPAPSVSGNATASI